MKTIVFLGNTCNYSFLYHKYTSLFTNCHSYSIIDYHEIKRDFPSWYEKDFYKIPNVFLINLKSKISYFYFFLKFIKQIGRKNISFHCFGLQSCILPLIFRVDFIYHGYGDILSTPFLENYKIKTLLRVLLSKFSLKYCKFMIVSHSTDIPYVKHFNVNNNKIKYIPIINGDLNHGIKNLKSDIDSLFDENKIIFVPTRNTEIKQLDILIDSLINIFDKNSSLFDENKIKIVFIKWGNLWEQHKHKFEQHKIDEYVFWIDLQSGEKLQDLLIKSYLIINEFTDPIKYPGFIGGITREAMSLGKPIITHYSFIHDHLFHKTRPPLIEFENNVTSLEKVLYNTIKLNNEDMLLFGKKMKTWYDSEYKKAELITKTINLHFE
tara:strand:- start:8772 stop:9908 length:1137 start_codon:yes stop_codon:yes gene_type:complete